MTKRNPAPGGLRFLSVCSGVEAASLAWGPLGWRALAFAQFDPEHNYARGPDFPSRVLAHRFPDVPNLGDLTRYEEWPEDLAPDVLCGGTPCQSFSAAGRRGGMADPRGQLSHCFVGVARRYRPRWVVWENVPGAYSADKGEAFRSIVGALEEFGYGVAWRVRDAQFFGVPQRRRRIVLVGYLGDWRPAAAVLFEPGGVRRDRPSRRKARTGVAGPAGLGLEGGCVPVGTLNCSARAPKPRFQYVHRLVLMAHRGPIPEGRVVNHLNGRKADNRLSNLEVATRSENAQHALHMGLVRTKKLTAAKAAAVRRAIASGKTRREVAQSLGISPALVGRVVRGETWKSLPTAGKAR